MVGDASCACAAVLAARLGQECDAEGLHKACRRQRARQRQHRAAKREHQPHQAVGRPEALQQGLVGQPFAHKPVERRQGRDGHRADQEEERRLRHPLDQPAHLLHVAGVRRVQDRARAQEQQRLEDRVVDGVIQPGDERQRRQHRVVRMQEHQGRPQPHQDDADILDAVIRQQPLEVVLHQRVEHAQHRGDGPDGQDRDAPPVRRRAHEVEEHTRQAVNAGLDHHAGQQRGGVAGRDRMGHRQPDVQRHDARLDAKAEQEQQKRRVAPAGGHLLPQRAESVEPVIPGSLPTRRLEQQQESEDQAAGADVRHDEKEHPGVRASRSFRARS